MDFLIPEQKQLRKSNDRCRLFSQITKKRRTTEQKQQKMLCTKDTMKSSQQQQKQPQTFNLTDFKQLFQTKIEQFKLSKAEQIADIAIDGDIPVKNIMKRIRAKLEKEIFEFIQKEIKDMDMYESKSAQKTTRSPKELGSTIQHTFTPKSIETPAFDFQSSQQTRINEFSVGSHEFTLNRKEENHNMKIKQCQKQQVVSEFSLGGTRNPTSKRIKDRIMNSKRHQERE